MIMNEIINKADSEDLLDGLDKFNDQCGLINSSENLKTTSTNIEII